MNPAASAPDTLNVTCRGDERRWRCGRSTVRYANLDSSATAGPESAAREEDHEGNQQKQPEQWANAYPTSNGSNHENNQNQLQESHSTS
jgi:hypothetical protein